MKQQIHCRVDVDVYYELKRRDEQINQLVNRLLKGYISTDYKAPSIEKLMRTIRELEDEIQGKKEKLARERMMLIKLEEEQDQEKKKQLEETMKKGEAFVKSGLWEDIAGR